MYFEILRILPFIKSFLPYIEKYKFDTCIFTTRYIKKGREASEI